MNGRFAGEHTGVWIPWDLDVTEHVTPGRVSEIAVAVKGAYYAHDPSHGQWRPYTRRPRATGTASPQAS